MQQIKYLVHRESLGTKRNAILSTARIVQSVIMALFVGAVYYNIGRDGQINLREM